MSLFLNILVICLVLGISIFVLLKFLKNIDKKLYKWFVIVLTIIHFMSSFIFGFFLDKFKTANDPQRYFGNAINSDSWFNCFGMGGDFVSFLVYPFAKIGITIETMFLVFALISYFGFIIYLKLFELNKIRNKIIYLFLLFFLIPSVHLWTGFVGKDALVFFLMAIFLQFIHKNKYNYLFFIILALIFVTRPHVFLIILFSLAILMLLKKEISLKTKFKYGLISLPVIIFCSIIFILVYVKIDSLSYESFVSSYNDFIQYSELGKDSTTYLSLSDTNIFTRMFYLLLMPLPIVYEIKNLFVLVSSFENIYYLIVFVFVIYVFMKNRKNITLTFDTKFAILTSIILIIVFSSYLFNLGWGNRLRVMFYPYLFYSFIKIIEKISASSSTNISQ